MPSPLGEVAGGSKRERDTGNPATNGASNGWGGRRVKRQRSEAVKGKP